MKITIDTKEDSKEEIKKVIEMLRAMVDGPVRIAPVDIFGGSGSSPAQDIFASSSSSQVPSSSPQSSSLPSSGSSQASGAQQGGDIFSLFSAPESPASYPVQPEPRKEEPKVRIIRY